MTNEQKKFFHADWHLAHKNILTLCNRRFTNIDEHDDYLIGCINEIVGKDDLLYILGDLGCHKDIKSLREYLKRINGRIHVILGNHDNEADLIQLKRERIIEDVKHFKTVQKGNKSIVCCHYPLKEWNGYYRGYYHCFGHVHNTIPQYDRCMDVGVDSIGFYPIEFDEVIKRIDYGHKNQLSTTDEMIKEYFPGLSTHYFTGLCTGHPEIRKAIEKALEEGSKGFKDE